MDDHTTKLRTCRQCDRQYPETSKYWHKDKECKGGLRAVCKQCKNASLRHNRSLDPEKHRERVRQWRIANPEKVKARNDQWRKEHPKEHSLNHKEWAENNREYLSEWQRRYYAANAEKLRKQARDWRARNRERDRLNGRRRRARNPERAKAKENRRRARKAQAEGQFTAADIQKMLTNQRGKCWYCLTDISTGYHIEHRVPLSRGGTNNPSNLVLACPPCNLSKHDKLPDEWNGRLL